MAWSLCSQNIRTIFLMPPPRSSHSDSVRRARICSATAARPTRPASGRICRRNGEATGPVKVRGDAPDGVCLRPDGDRRRMAAGPGPHVFLFRSCCRSWSSSRIESVPPRFVTQFNNFWVRLYIRQVRGNHARDSRLPLFGTASSAGFIWKEFAGWATLPALCHRRTADRESQSGSPPSLAWRDTEADYRTHPGRPGRRRRPRLHPQRPHFPIARRPALQAGKHVICEKPWPPASPRPRNWSTLASETKLRNSTLRITCASTPWCSRCAACARPATWATSWWCRAPIPRTGCSTTPIGIGGSTAKAGRPPSRHGRCRLALVRHGRTRHRTAHHIRLRRYGTPSQDRKQPKGPRRDLCRQNFAARGLHRDPHRYGGLRRRGLPHGRPHARAPPPPAR